MTALLMVVVGVCEVEVVKQGELTRGRRKKGGRSSTRLRGHVSVSSSSNIWAGAAAAAGAG